MNDLKRIVVLPSEPIEEYLKLGTTYEQMEQYFNPGGYFDEVYCLSLWGKDIKKIGKVTYVKCRPYNLSRIVKKIGPLVVRAYGGYISSDLAQIGRVRNIPIVTSIHDRRPSFIFKSVGYSDYLICMSNVVKESVLKQVEFDKKKIWILPNRIDEELMKKTSDDVMNKLFESQYGTGKHILHVGRKTEEKNLDTLIRALPLLARDVSVIFVGQGDCEIYKQLAQKLNVSERVFFEQAIEHQKLPALYSWCDCFCVPSRDEGFGMVFIEAAACEAAIVTSNISPMNEYLTSGKDAILVDDYNNPEAVADALNIVLDNKVDVERMKRNARKVALKFTQKEIDSHEADIYKTIIEQKPEYKKMPWIEITKLKLKYEKRLLRSFLLRYKK